MSTNDPCFEHIIGLTRSQCECLGCSSDDEISDSDLYLDELEPLSSTLIQALESCEKGDLCDIMRNARAEAVKKTKTDILKKILENNQPARAKFKGSIGNLATTDTLLLSQTYSGVRMLMADVRSGYMRITNIRPMFAEDHTGFSLMIYNNIGDLVDTVLLNAIADTLTANTVDIELPLHYDFLNNTKYFFIYASAGMNPYNLGVGCGWNEQNPCFHKHFKGWESWAMLSGYTTDTLNFIDHNIYTGNICNTNGLIFDVEFYCKSEEVICKDEFDYVGNPLAMSVAFAVLYQTAIYTVDTVFGDTEMNQLRMANGETLMNYRAKWVEDYDKEIAYLGQYIDINANDCFKCRDKYGFINRTIFA